MAMTRRFAVCSACAVSGFAALAAGRPVVESLGEPPRPLQRATVWGCADSNCEVLYGSMYRTQAPAIYHAFRWTALGGFQDLTNLSGVADMRAAIPSADGSAFACLTNSATEAYTWSPPAAPSGLGLLPGMAFSSPQQISADGGVIVGCMNSASLNSCRGFLWTASGGLVDLNLPATPYFIGIGWLAADGSSLIGEMSPPGPGTRRVFRWTPGGVTYLPNLQGVGSSSARASADGATVIGCTFPLPQRLVVWRNDVPTDYGLALGGVLDAISVTRVSADGRVSVGRMENSFSGTGHAFIWKKNTGFLNAKNYLASLGWDVSQWGALSSVSGISADGRTVVGTGFTLDNRETGWRAVNAIPPACDGDFDGDGDVDTADLAALLGGFGSCPGGASYQIHLNMNEADPCINTGDLVLMLAAFGNACG